MLLKKKRLMKNMTMDQMSETGDISKTMISFIENRKHTNPTLRIIVGIASALDMTCDEVINAIADVGNEGDKKECFTCRYGLFTTPKAAVGCCTKKGRSLVAAGGYCDKWEQSKNVYNAENNDVN